MDCQHCGHSISPGTKFCGQCGKEVKSTVGASPVTGAAKDCPACHAEIAASRYICPNCGFRFGVTDVAASNAGIGSTVGCFIVAGLIAFGLYSCVSDSPEDLAAQQASEQVANAKSAEDRLKGFHCLSAWDGSSSSLVRQVKAQLRDPDSFEHDETKITPRDVKGQHLVTMRYRAKNGFGGMNVATAVGVVDGGTCEATLVTGGE